MAVGDLPLATTSDCPFCNRLALGDLPPGNGMAAALPDAFPLNPGHTLVVPRRHVASFFELRRGEQAAIWRLVAEVKSRLDSEVSPAGYNIGLNVGPAGGQTVGHAHVHVIPRFVGDVADPRGGVRWVVPVRAAYWNTTP